MPSDKPQQRVLAILGGGAAGFFASIAAARKDPHAQVVLFERSARVLSKVRISGGGRCNVTHACFDPAALVSYYPRGEKELRQAFSRFQPADTVRWFEAQGVQLKREPDGRMFPVTDDSATIVDCLIAAAREAGVEVRTGTAIVRLHPLPAGGFILESADTQFRADKVLVATGGSPSASGLAWLKTLGHAIVQPVPSLFTFNLPGDSIIALQGVAVDPAEVKLSGTKWKETGPVLVTHWGLSGPAVLRMSARAARELAAVNYRQEVVINWLPAFDEPALRAHCASSRQAHGTRQLRTDPIGGLPRRMWEYLLESAGVDTQCTWSSLRAKDLNRLCEKLLRDRHRIDGKTTFREEFVTCGGVSLKEVDFKTMQSRKVPGLFFAGEVLDIDGLTGGFNFQAAWTTGYIAGNAMAESSS